MVVIVLAGDRGDRLAGVHRGLVERTRGQRADPAAVEPVQRPLVGRRQRRPVVDQAAPEAQPRQHTSQHQQSKPARYKVTISAANGDSWVSAHVGASDGPAATTVRGTDLSQYLLHQGEVAT